MKPPKKPETIAAIERMKIYLRDNPTCKLEDAAKILDIKSCTVRKWKQRGWIEHTTPFVARQQQAQAVAAGKQPLPRPMKQKRVRTPVGVVAPPPESSEDEPDSIEALIKRGQGLKISEIRAMIKAYLMTQVHDAKAVSNYAAGLRALSGVQDVELEDIYESEQMMTIYVPEEDVLRKKDVLEVDRIEY